MDTELRIALMQTTLVWENPEMNRNVFSERIYGIPEEVDVIVLPEMFSTGFTMNPHRIDPSESIKTVEWMQAESHKKNAALIGSIAFYENGSYFNRLYFVEPNGNLQTYDKRHTFTLAGEDKVYTAGTKKLVVDYKGFRICPLVCYDLRFPVWARNVEGYDLLLYVASWPKPRINAWDSLLKARAIENMAYCIGVNRVGIDEAGHEYPGHSAVYDCLGETLVFSDKEEILYASLSKAHLSETRERLKFLEDRDGFSLEL